MAVNAGGKFNITATPYTMEQYDSLPYRIRKIIAEAPYNISTSRLVEYLKSRPISSTDLLATIQHNMCESTKITYGPDHPQAQ